MQRISVFAAIAAAFGVFVSGPGLAQTADGLTPAEETICDVLDGVGAAWGLCNAYCEAMDCDGDPRASQKACNKVLQRFESVSEGQPLPCGQKTVFTTFGQFTGDLAFEGGGADGLAGADILCQEAADSAGAIVPAGVYVAFLSTVTVDAGDRISDAEYVLPDGTLIATDKTDLLDGEILTPINQDEFGAPIPVPGGLTTSDLFVWTGSNSDGTAASSTCENWTTSAGTPSFGAIGFHFAFGSPPTEFWLGGGGVAECSGIHSSGGGGGTHLYCFQQ